MVATPTREMLARAKDISQVGDGGDESCRLFYEFYIL